MQARYELFNKLCKLKGEIEIQIKDIVLYKSSLLFNQRMNQLIPQFDIALKQIPKTVSFKQDQKPVALQDFLIKFQKKIDHRKESLLNRYLREIEQLKTEFTNISKRATSKSIEFIEDTQKLEQRFKRQLSIRKRLNSDSIDSLTKNQKNELNFKEIEEQNNQIKNKEENRIIQIKQNELATLKLQIEQLKQELREELNQNQDYNNDLIEKKKESNQQKIAIIKNQKNDEIDLIKKQIKAVQSDIQSVTDRISNMQQTQIETKNSFQSIIDHFSTQIKQQTELKISQIKDEIQSNQTKISSLMNKIQSPIVPLNKESFELKLAKELRRREEKLKSEENNKRIEFENQIIAKINEHHSILKEIFQIETKTEILKEKVEKENQIKIQKLRNDNQKEIDEINNELTKSRADFLNLANSKENGELIYLQIKLTDMNIKLNQLEQEEVDFKNSKNNLLSIKEPINEGDEIDSISESFSQKELNSANKIQLIINKLNGQLHQFQNNLDEDESISDLHHQFLLEKVRQAFFEKKSIIELNEKERNLNEINQDNENLFKIENRSENMFFSVDSIFDIIDEYQLKIENDDDEDKKEKERLKKLIFELKEKRKIEVYKLHSIVDQLNKLKNDFSLSFDENEIHEFESNFVSNLINKENEMNLINSKSKELELIKKVKIEIEESKQSNSKEIDEDNEILLFLKRKEIEKYYNSILNAIKESNHFKEELMRIKLKIIKRELEMEEKDEELVFNLKSEISNLEKQIQLQIDSSQSHHVNRKAPLPPLKDS